MSTEHEIQLQKNREYSRVYCAKNRQKIRAQQIERYHRNIEHSREYRRKYRAEHYDKIYKSDKNWNETNRIKKRAQMLACRLVPLKSGCEICGCTENLTRHHKDYGKPLEVLTLCKLCHKELEKIEPPICTKQPDIRYYKGYEAVEVLDSSNTKRGQTWPCKVIATGEIRQITVGHLCYIPHNIRFKHIKKEMQK